MTGMDHLGAGVSLVCAFCAATRAPDLRPHCDLCGGTLAVRVDRETRVPAAPRTLWDFAAMLPAGRERVTLGEGGTPLLPLSRLFPEGPVFMKAEWVNPTGSFKDRGAAVAVSAAFALGADGVVCASTGNNAAAVSAYAARAGLPCIVALPKETPEGKIVHVRAHGALLAEVSGTFSDAYALAARVHEADRRWANLTSTYLNPFMTVAHTTIFYELFRQLGGEVGTVVIPIAPARCWRE